MPSTESRVRLVKGESVFPLSALAARCPHFADGVPLAWYLTKRGHLAWEIVRDMECLDVHSLASLLMRSQYLADTDRRLFELDSVLAPALRPFTPSSLRVAYVLGGLTLLTLLGFCGFITHVIL